jgi:hypothetical protein
MLLSSAPVFGLILVVNVQMFARTSPCPIACSCVITLPNLILFSLANSTPPRELLFIEELNSQKVLATSTIASLHEPIPSCRETFSEQKFGFSCPEPFVISSVVAYYGSNWGSCACPLDQQTDVHGFCKGTTVSKEYPGECEETGPPGQETAKPCFRGTTRYGNTCCSNHVKRDGSADLTSLNIAPNITCNSLTAPYIATALCEGHASCEFLISFNQTYTFPVASLPSNVNASSICPKVIPGPNGGTCATNFLHGGVFNGCDFDHLGMIFEAICVSADIEIGKKYYSPHYIVLVATSLNAIGILVFILSIAWIKYSQTIEAEAIETGACSAADYTVVIKTLPKLEPNHSPENEANNCVAEDYLARMREALHAHVVTVISNHDQDESGEIKIADINFSTSRSDYLVAACTRGTAASEADRILLQISTRMEQEVFDKESKYDLGLIRLLRNAVRRFQIANDECRELSEQAELSLYSAFVTFEDEASFISCLKAFPNTGYLTTFIQPPETKLDGRPVIVKPAWDPTNIIWENLAIPIYSQFFRVLLTTFLTLLILTISFAMIYEAKFLSDTLSTKKDYQACGTYDVLVSKDANAMYNVSSNTITYRDVLWDKSPLFYINATSGTSYGSLGYLQCYCEAVLSEAKGNVTAMQNYFFYDGPTNSYRPYCKDLTSGSALATAANYVATFIIILVNTNLQALLRAFVDFERPSTKTRQIMSLVLKLFIAQYINTAILTLIINGSLTKAGGHNLIFGTSGNITFGIFTGSIEDYDTTWYFTVGSSIMFTMFMFSL